MSRSIVTKRPASPNVRTRGVPDGDFMGSDDHGSGAEDIDNYGDRLLKLIPGEVVGVYLSMQAILSNAQDVNMTVVPWLVFAFGVFATWFYLYVPLKVVNRRQIVITVGAFCVWAFTIGAPFDKEHLAWWSPTYAGLLLLAYTFIAPKIPLGDEA
ncbi:MAG: hypothetical protein AB8G16_12425 [Gammaproteobacteria bacterium]